jgi:transposase
VLPADYPPWTVAHRFFTRWRKQGLIGESNDRLRATREAEGRDAEPTAGAIDSQSAKDTSTVEAATSGMSPTSTCAAALHSLQLVRLDVHAAKVEAAAPCR